VAAISKTELSEREEQIGKAVVQAAYTVHRGLGPGLLESVYEPCFCHELEKQGLAFKRQIKVPIVYDGLSFPEAFRIDVLVDDLVICELKAAEDNHPVYLAQLLTYLKLTNKQLGFVINFNVPLIKSGIQRVVHPASVAPANTTP
jgi:GxxExxY protein